MGKFILILVAVIVVCITICYTTSRVCDVIDSKTNSLSNGHEVLMKDHEALMRISNETCLTVKDTNEKITFLYNMIKNQNPDLKMND